MRLAEKVAAQHPELGAHPIQISGGNTEMTAALRLGIPALTIIGQTRGDTVPHWHQVEDTFDKMDPEALGRAYAFTAAFVAAVDTRAAN
jgi:hypothetical protein